MMDKIMFHLGMFLIVGFIPLGLLIVYIIEKKKIKKRYE